MRIDSPFLYGKRVFSEVNSDLTIISVNLII